MKFLSADQLSLVSSDSYTDIDSRLAETFIMIPGKAFAGLSVLTVLHQLLSAKGKLKFLRLPRNDKMKHLLGLKLWYLC